MLGAQHESAGGLRFSVLSVARLDADEAVVRISLRRDGFDHRAKLCKRCANSLAHFRRSLMSYWTASVMILTSSGVSPMKGLTALT